jgi:Ni/Fe-hydrogenase 1 B-type cytochrome subunit
MEKVIGFQQPESLFRAQYSLSIRIWHWLTFLLITASIITVLFASTLFTIKANSNVIQEQVQQKGGILTTAQARAAGHELNDKFWELHRFIGFGLCFLLLCRAFIEIRYSKEQKLSTKIRKAVTFQPQTPAQRSDRQHYIWVKWGYVVFYLLLLIMGLTGLILAFEDVEALRSIRPLAGGIHRIVQFLLYAYILFHIAGVIRADVTDNKGIVSRMINGSAS